MTRGPGESGDPSLYFAYGSNLASARMRERVDSARRLCSALAPDFRVSFGKAGRDGSGKATLVPAGGSLVWGVVYVIDPAAWPILDGFEGGYTRTAITLTSDRAEPLAANTYIAPESAPDPTAYAWYKQLILEGAREHGLPADYVAVLAALPARSER